MPNIPRPTSKVQRPRSEVQGRFNRDALKALLNRYGIAEETQSALRFLKYLDLLEKWNARVNLTATTDWDTLGALFEEGIWAAGSYPETSVSHLDIGSGSGFPALLMRIMRPRMRLTMVEPRGKRTAFLETACHELALTGSMVFNGRLEEFVDRRAAAERWDFVSWKALKLERREITKLLLQCDRQTQFWLFHSARLPVADDATELLELQRREPFPGKPSWHLSFMRKNVSRET